MTGIGNVMRHDYEYITARWVWGAITGYLDELKRSCVCAELQLIACLGFDR